MVKKNEKVVRVLMELDTFYRNENEKFVLRITKREGSSPRLEKRRFLFENGEWVIDVNMNLIYPDMLILEKYWNRVIEVMSDQEYLLKQIENGNVKRTSAN